MKAEGRAGTGESLGLRLGLLGRGTGSWGTSDLLQEDLGVGVTETGCGHGHGLVVGGGCDQGLGLAGW